MSDSERRNIRLLRGLVKLRYTQVRSHRLGVHTLCLRERRPPLAYPARSTWLQASPSGQQDVCPGSSRSLGTVAASRARSCCARFRTTILSWFSGILSHRNDGLGFAQRNRFVPSLGAGTPHSSSCVSIRLCLSSSGSCCRPAGAALVRLADRESRP